jgi:hypothetical protein
MTTKKVPHDCRLPINGPAGPKSTPPDNRECTRGYGWLTYQVSAARARASARASSVANRSWAAA